jgi:hypothetical protein
LIVAFAPPSKNPEPADTCKPSLREKLSDIENLTAKDCATKTAATSTKDNLISTMPRDLPHLQRVRDEEIARPKDAVMKRLPGRGVIRLGYRVAYNFPPQQTTESS